MKKIDFENFVLSSEQVVNRGAYYVQLSHKPDAVKNMETLNRKGLNVISGHNPNPPAGGKAKGLSLSDGKLTTSQFETYETEAGREMYEMLSNGYDSVSVGVSFDDEDIGQEEHNGRPLIKINKYTVDEVSLVGVPAIKNVGTFAEDFKEGRGMLTFSADPILKEQTIKENTKMKNEDVKTPEVNLDEIRNVALSEERSRISEINKLGKEANAEDLAQSAIDSGDSVEQFNAKIVSKLLKDKKETPNLNITQLDTSAMGQPVQKQQEFSLQKALGDWIQGRNDTYEMELAKSNGNELFVPFNALTMAVDSTVAGAGLEWLETTTDPRFLDVLRDYSIIPNLGIQSISVSGGSHKFYKQTDDATTETVNRTTGEAALTDPTTDEVVVVSTGRSARTKIYRNALTDTTGQMEGWVRNSLLGSYGKKLDVDFVAQAIAAATAASPSQTVSFAVANAPTYAEIMNLVKIMSSANVDPANGVFLMNTSTAVQLEITERFASTGQTVIQNGKAAGRPYVASNTVSGDAVLFLDPSKIVQVHFGDGLRITRDDITAAASGAVNLIVYGETAFGILYDEAIAYGAS